jgi:DNA-binding beta-propeller fold protein YncE
MHLKSQIRNAFGNKLPIWLFTIGIISVCAPALGGKRGGSGDPVPAARVWPAPPDEPRVVYVRTINKPTDIGVKSSVFRRIRKWITGSADADRTMINPLGVALDEKGNLCVTDTGAKTVCWVDITGKHWQQWDHVGAIHFSAPVAVAKRGNTLFVADSALGEVIAFNTDGKLLFEIKRDLGRPSGLALLGERLFVTDVEQHCVVAFDLRGNKVSSFGKRGTGSGEFNFPTHAAADNQGHLLITDSMNSRVQVFDADGKFLSEIGSAGDTSGHFGRPKGVAVDSFGHVYVADAVFDNIQVFDFSGRLLLNLGETGSGPGEFGLPNGVAIGADNQIYVADSYNHRVQVLKYIGQQ